MKKRVPHHPVEEVRRLAAAGRVRILQSRALAPLLKHFGGMRGRRLAEQALANLSADDFVETIEQRRDQFLDVYAVLMDAVDWYVKIEIIIAMDGEEQVLCISFHYPERTMITVSGRKVIV